MEIKKLFNIKIKKYVENLRKLELSGLEFSTEKTVRYFHEASNNNPSITPIFVENIGSFNKLKIIGFDQRLLNQ